MATLGQISHTRKWRTALTVRWHRTLIQANHLDVPAAAGIYVYAQEQNRLGLRVSLEILYVGKSRSLKRRFSEHSVMRESNHEFLQFLNANPGSIAIYYTTEVQDIDQAETLAIAALRPRFNINKLPRDE